MNCLGYRDLDKGHNRVPDPPDRITGNIFVMLFPWNRPFAVPAITVTAVIMVTFVPKGRTNDG